jgi:N-acetylmuramoyl-L-alanine amidase
MALKRVWIASPNFSSRGGSGVRLVVVHTAEGARSFRDLGGFFASSSAGVSSHVGIDDERGSIGEYVHRPDKAWTQSNYNPQAVSVELCAAPIDSSHPCGANWSSEEWNRHDGMLANLADWIREECTHFGLPITKLSSSQAQGSGRGVCGHVDLGAGGGGHWDPGPNFPWSRVMEMARGEAVTEPTEEDFDMIASERSADGTLHVWNVGPQRESVYLTFQKPGSNAWHGGEPGERIAGPFKFCDAAKGRKIRGVAAAVADNGNFHFFMTYDNADIVYRWQAKGSTDWSELAMFAPWG